MQSKASEPQPGALCAVHARPYSWIPGEISGVRMCAFGVFGDISAVLPGFEARLDMRLLSDGRSSTTS